MTLLRASKLPRPERSSASTRAPGASGSRTEAPRIERAPVLSSRPSNHMRRRPRRTSRLHTSGPRSSLARPFRCRCSRWNSFRSRSPRMRQAQPARALRYAWTSPVFPPRVVVGLIPLLTRTELLARTEPERGPKSTKGSGSACGDRYSMLFLTKLCTHAHASRDAVFTLRSIR